MKDSLNITEDILPLDGAYAFPLPTDMDVFSYKLSIGTKCEWLKWEDDIDTAAPLPRDIFACQVTEKQCSLFRFLQNLSHSSLSFLLVKLQSTAI